MAMAGRRLVLLCVALACAERRPSPPVAALAGVVDPWSWPAARRASATERALEDLGPWEPRDLRDPASPPVSVNRDHWSRLVGLPWDRDVTVAVVHQPVDLD